MPAPSSDRDLGTLADGAFVVEAPLHGGVARVLVSVGDRVAPGDAVVTLEAMKTESAVPSPVGGTVTRVVCRGRRPGGRRRTAPGGGGR